MVSPILTVYVVAGDVVGLSVGSGVEARVGTAVGLSVGTGVGAVVGLSVGTGVGASVGEGVGAVVGLKLGQPEHAVGAGLGAKVGAGVVGAAVGVRVGAAVGVRVGAAVGVRVGGSDGEGVGSGAAAVRVMVPLDLDTVLLPVAHNTAIVTDPEDGMIMDVLEQVHFRRPEQLPPDIVPAVEVNTH